MKDIHYSVEFTLNNGDSDAFEALAKECISHVKHNEPGTRSYQWYLSEDGRVCHLEEWFKDSKAMMAHLTGTVATEILPKLLEVGSITRFDVHGNPSDEGLKALSAFGTRNFQSMAGFTR